MFDKEIVKTFDRRSALFITGGVILTSVLILRMMQMQMFQYGKYKRLSENNATRIRVNLPERGKILAMGGAALARDAFIYRIYLIPDETADLNGTIDTLQSELNLRQKDIDRIWRRIRRQRGFQPVIIKEGADWEKLANLRAGNLTGIHIERGLSRRYPGRRLAAHAIGYVGGLGDIKPDSRMLDTSPFFMVGVAGLEKSRDAELSGTPGHSVINIDASGRIIGEDESGFVPAKDGQDVQTTLRESVQKKLEDGLELHRSGCGIAIEIDTGNIVAMASSPSFDPDSFRADDGAEQIEELRNNPLKPFMNKTIEGLYPPGSTFKIVVALAALESGALLSSEKIHCPGHWEYGNHMYHCWEKKGHGWVDLENALAHSCDVYFYQIALRIGIDAIKSMALRLGLMQKLLNELPREMNGIIPDKTWKEKNVGARWQHGDTIISGIGQGFILANCLQLCVMTARTVSNKAVVPRLVIDVSRESGVGNRNESRLMTHDSQFPTLGLQEKNIKLVMSGLQKVLEQGGTAAGAAINVNGAKMGGKTGTSQVRRISMEERQSGVRTNEQLDWRLRNHGLFVGYAPLSNPKYAIATITEHSGSSGPAAKVASDTMREMLKSEK